LVVDPVCEGNHPLVKLVVAGLVASNEEHGRPTGIEGIEDAIGVATYLNPKLAHVAMLRATDV
jgi:hypothetical protein